MKRLGAFVVCMAAFANVLPAEGPAPRSVQATSTQKLDFAPGGTIRFESSAGDLYVEGWDQAQVEVTVTRSTNFYEPAAKAQGQAAAKLDKVHVLVQARSDKELVVATTPSAHKGLTPHLPRNTVEGVTLEYRVYVPRETRVVIDHRGGFVLVGNVTGDIDAVSNHGDIMLMLAETGAYAIDAKAKMGHIASDFSGSTHSRYVIGQHFAGEKPSTARRIHVRVGFGGITILSLPPEGEALSVAGKD